MSGVPSASMPAPASPLRPAVLGVILGSLALAWLLRSQIVDPPVIAQTCDVTPWQGWCIGRSMLMATFQHQELGWLGLAAGAGALIWRRAWLMRAALVFGCLGLILFSYDPAAFGLLAGLLAACRRPKITSSP